MLGGTVVAGGAVVVGAAVVVGDEAVGSEATGAPAVGSDSLGDDVGTTLLRTAYHDVAKGYGGKGFLVRDPKRIPGVLRQAKALAAEGKPVCINLHIAKSDFRKGSISM